LDARVGSGASAERVADHLLAALRAVWSRSSVIIGPVTLSAIFSRVLESTTRELPLLERIGLRIGKDWSLSIDSEVVRVADNGELLEATRRVLVEFLSVLGRLTGETLTPMLHAELSRTVVDETSSPPKRSTPREEGPR
jgi:hypothetical protein